MKIYYVLILLAAFLFAGCNSGQPAAENSPRAVFEAYIAAHNRKDAEGMKRAFSADTVKMYEAAAQRDKTSVNGVIEEQLKANPANMQTLQMEFIKEEIEGDTAIVEARKTTTNEIVKMPCVRENGQWKLALDKFVKETLKKNKS